MVFLETMLGTSASLIALFFAVLGIVNFLEEKNEFFPAQSLRISILSLAFFFLAFFISLFVLTMEEFSILIDKIVIYPLVSFCLASGVICMIFSLRMLITRL